MGKIPTYKMDFMQGQENCLTVTTASILDYLFKEKNAIQFPSQLLDEHFRSLPQLANYTSKAYYKNSDNPTGLRVMTETPDKMNLETFHIIKVNGKRTLNKTVVEEAKKVVEIIEAFYNKTTEGSIFLPEYLVKKKDLSIGILSMIRNQCDLIDDLLDDTVKEQFNIKIATPEEFQGDERDIMIISLAIDDSVKRGHSFFQNPNRMNVATSRAKFFTYLVYTHINPTFDAFKQYVHHFIQHYQINESLIAETAPVNVWKNDENSVGSDLKRSIQSVLEQYRNLKKVQGQNIIIYNNIKACGGIPLTFVVFNQSSKQSVVVEIDGLSFSNEAFSNQDYAKVVNQNTETLQRGGWTILYTTYYKWFNKSWLASENNYELRQEIQRIYQELDSVLLVKKEELI